MQIPRFLFAQFLCAGLLLAVCGAAFANDQPKVVTVDADLGSCKADFTVKDGAGKPIYNSKISVLIKYGFMNLRQTDLDAYTNVDGQANFTGLPNFPKKPLEFFVSSGTVSRIVAVDPVAKCNAVFDVTLAVR